MPLQKCHNEMLIVPNCQRISYKLRNQFQVECFVSALQFLGCAVIFVLTGLATTFNRIWFRKSKNQNAIERMHGCKFPENIFFPQEFFSHRKILSMTCSSHQAHSSLHKLILYQLHLQADIIIVWSP